MTVIAKDLFVSNFSSAYSVVNSMRHLCVTMFVPHNSVWFEYFASSADSKFGVTHPDEEILASFSDSDAAFILTAALASLSNPARPKDKFLFPPFY